MLKKEVLSKKSSAGDIENVWTKTRKTWEISSNECLTFENIIQYGKRRLSNYEYFLLLPQGFQKSSAAEASEKSYQKFT